jgi:hypothetical protein
MKTSRFIEIKDLCEELDDLPDGAFMAVLAERGVSTDDLFEYSQEVERRKQRQKSKRR